MTGTAARLVVTADDFGLTDGVCGAIFDAHDAGTVSATSVLAVGPALARHAARLVQTPTLEAGLHIALVGEDPPLLSPSEIPSLVDGQGQLAPSWTVLVKRLALGRIDAADIERESRAQMDQVRGLGIQLTHVNTHQHTHLWPSIGRVLLDLAAREAIDVVRMPGGDRSSLRSSLIAPLGTLGRRRMSAGEMICPDRVLGLTDAGSMTGDRLAGALDRAASCAGISELVLHPGRPDDPRRSRYRWQYDWAGEWRALTDGTVTDLLTERDLQVVAPSALATR